MKPAIICYGPAVAGWSGREKAWKRVFKSLPQSDIRRRVKEIKMILINFENVRQHRLPTDCQARASSITLKTNNASKETKATREVLSVLLPPPSEAAHAVLLYLVVDATPPEHDQNTAIEHFCPL
jgi:hypothetical protein